MDTEIAVFVTGGTFDKEYNELTGELYFRDTHLPEMLALGRARLPLRLQTLMMKDSLQMTDADREAIAGACREAAETAIVITHGTDTMERTAAHLAGQVSGKTIVLTGAMIPYKFGSSDGLFNLGAALALVQQLPAGIYVAMNGRCFDWNAVTKNRVEGVFVAKPPSLPSSKDLP
jgi:L-asparaginase